MVLQTVKQIADIRLDLSHESIFAGRIFILAKADLTVKRKGWKKKQKHLTRMSMYIIIKQDTNVSSKGEKIWYRKKN